MDIISAHKYSSKHRDSILKSKKCGCFNCLEIFTANEITDWCDFDATEIGQTAICPKCSIDSVIGDYDLYFDKQFLKDMQNHWFLKSSSLKFDYSYP